MIFKIYAMNRYMIKGLLLSAMFTAFCAGSMAQVNSSAYFLEGSYMRYKMNPAFQPERSMLALPGISGLDITANLNAGLSNFIFESTSHPGDLTTFMSADVSPEDFLGALPDNTRLNLGMDVNLLTVGFGGEKWYSSIGLSVHSKQSTTIPKSMFEFMKSGLSQGNYMIKDLNVNSVSYLEAAFNFSYKVIDNLTVGATFKFLDGIEYADVNVDYMEANIQQDKWQVRTNMTSYVAAAGADVQLKDNEFDKIDYNFTIPSNYGFAADLGVEYDMKDLFDGILEGLKVSASITDLGMLTWKQAEKLYTDNTEYVEFAGFSELDIENTSDDKTIEDLGDDCKELINLYEDTPEDLKYKLSPTFRFGAEYNLPWVPMISVGELLTYSTFLENSLESCTSLTLSPGKWFDISGNMTFSKYFNSLGWIINMHPAGLNLFIASNMNKIKVNPQMIPLEKCYADLNIGIIFNFGQNRF